jgi:hypothetical protein
MESRNQQLIQMMQATKKEPKITCDVLNTGKKACENWQQKAL